MTSKYDVAAYVWPAYTGDEPRTRMFWPEAMGEWQSVKNSVKKFPAHNWPRKPLWGYVNEADPYIMEMQIEAAVDHGVNVFIYDWYWYDRRPFLEGCLNDGFLKAKNKDKMKFYLMWANHDALGLWDIRVSDDSQNVIWNGEVDRSEFERLAKRLIAKYFKLPNYYTIDGKPVLMIYDVPKFVKGLGGIENANAALEWFRQEAIKEGLDGLHLQFTLTSEGIPNRSGVDGERDIFAKEYSKALHFDSTSHYQFAHFTNIDRDYLEILEDMVAEWDKVERDFLFPYFPHISVGWDNNPRFVEFRNGIVKNNTPENFEKGLRMVKAYMDKHPEQAPLMTINSWNEWTETSYLEPDDQYGYGYLDAIKRVFG